MSFLSSLFGGASRSSRSHQASMATAPATDAPDYATNPLGAVAHADTSSGTGLGGLFSQLTGIGSGSGGGNIISSLFGAVTGLFSMPTLPFMLLGGIGNSLTGGLTGGYPGQRTGNLMSGASDAMSGAAGAGMAGMAGMMG